MKSTDIKKSDIFFLILCMTYIVGLYQLLTAYPKEAVACVAVEQINHKVIQEPVEDSFNQPIPRVRPTNVNHTSKSLIDSLRYQVVHNNQSVNEFISEPINMPLGKEYAALSGVTCFRGNNFRDSASYGKAKVEEAKLEQLWQIPIGGIDSWTGVGWNGQPAIVKWDEQWKGSMNLFQDKKLKSDLKEVIYAALDGKVYFLDLDNGEPTRPVIQVPGPVKGSLTVDPRGLPLLYVGQGIDKVQGRRVEMGYRIFSLINQERLFFLQGYDSYAFRGWGAFDSTALVDSATDTLLLGGENGIFYRIKLNSNYGQEQNKITVSPIVTKYRYQLPVKGSHQGIENSVAVYKNYAFFADNGGVLQCVDLNLMQPIWARDVTDDTDSTCVLEVEDEQNVFLYSACEVDKQGHSGSSYIRKFDALTGEPQWEKSYKCYYNSHTNGGALASPVLGKQEISNLIIYNLARYGTPGGGVLVALDRYSGEEVWKLNLPSYCWSSPVDVYTENGDAYLIVCDSVGRMYLIKGKTGEVLDTINLGANVEGSPAVYDNIVVVGTRGQRIIGVKIK